MPSAESGGVMNMWYSFNYKNVHFVNINTGEPPRRACRPD